MIELAREMVEGQPWTALAASAAGADASFATLPTPGRARSSAEGQALYLESRLCEIPATPPRRLLLVRDVTAGRVADQTIRSLFQFLQDRDEDRTRICAGRTPRSRPSATASRATCTTAPCRACRPPRSRSRPPCS